MGLDALNWYDVAQDRSRWHDLCSTISSGRVPRGLSVVTGSLSVAVGELLVALRILLDIEDIALVNLLHSGKQSSAVGVAEFSGVKVISRDTSTTVPVKAVPGPVPWIQDPAIVY